MTITDFFAKITKFSCPSLPSLCSANTVQEMYSNCIENNLPKVDTIKKWHVLLKQYIDDPEAIFFIRRYASTKDKNGNWDIRRGFLTIYNNIKYVYVDNFFAHYFHTMAINNFVPEYSDFKQFIINRKFPIGFSVVEAEKEHQAYIKGPQCPLNKNGWKLSHVFSANGNDYDFDYQKERMSLFPKGNYSDYVNQGGSPYPYRKINQTLSPDDIQKIKAHFFRVVHPINQFLTPKVKFQTSSKGINDIGEYEYMINFMKSELNKNYGPIFSEYMDIIRVDTKKLPESRPSAVIELVYGSALSKPATKLTTAKVTTGSTPTRSITTRTSVTFTSKQVAECIKAYLFDGESFRNIESHYLGVPARANGGGWIARELLKSKGVNSSMKKMFSGKSVSQAISESKEPLKSTLISIFKPNNLD